MRIIILSIKNNRYTKLLADSLKQEHDVKVIFCSAPIHNKNLFQSIVFLIRKSGLRYFFFKVFEVLSSRTRYKGIDTCSISNINDHPDLVKDLKPDIIFASVFPLIVSNEVLKIPRFGCYNIHRSYLPEYEGKTPIFWALANNEKQNGVTIHEMTEKIDKGRKIYRKRVPVSPEDDYHDLALRTAEVMAGDILQVVRDIREGRRVDIADKRKGEYFSFPDRAAVKRYFSRKQMIKKHPVNYFFKLVPF